MTNQTDCIEQPTDEIDDLTGFLQWVLKHLSVIGMVPFKSPVWKIQDVTSILLYRDAPFQVQMFVVPGNTIIPEHTHPNVDSYEVYVGGDINFSHSGKYVLSKEKKSEDTQYKTAVARGEVIRVHPNDWHGGVFGPDGGVFLSVQKWLNGVEPHCVAADYVGTVMGEDHFNKVVFGKPSLKEQLSEDDVIKSSEKDKLQSTTKMTRATLQ